MMEEMYPENDLSPPALAGTGHALFPPRD